MKMIFVLLKVKVEEKKEDLFIFYRCFQYFYLKIPFLVEMTKIKIKKKILILF